ncbi:SDR family oxidoreductase [Micromonospora endolithica]|uniref:SDR family oxidoreductase n=1 Tax=Micromonospora endolithica TaxID=230091 RepID=A0A3A9ZSC2_9ACTN|nr:SDR family oxidoreductase [Micromonospora endolithica]RKN51172.1 SDR family oxidoreductase [Micromonospora endolithica]TWJ22379.1 uncharacterized protein YbjT (DUF2867 family) [Micromonospora endolithica]
MKIVVIGGSGLIGSKLVTILRQRGHEVVAASPSTGVNTLTGEGLAAAVAGAAVVVDVSNSPSFADDAAREFFETSTGNLLAAEAEAGVGHHVVLSVVNADRITDSGYMRAKVVQEKLVASGGIGWSVVRATQFFEFVGAILDGSTDGGVVHLAPVLFQPVAADDVAATLADVALGAPVGGVVDLGGPERFRFDEFGRAALTAAGDGREVRTDPAAGYFGASLAEDSLVPSTGARTGSVTIDQWRARNADR